MKKIISKIRKFFRIRKIENQISEANIMYCNALSIHDNDTATIMRVVVEKLKEQIQNIKDEK